MEQQNVLTTHCIDYFKQYVPEVEDNSHFNSTT